MTHLRLLSGVLVASVMGAGACNSSTDALTSGSGTSGSGTSGSGGTSTSSDAGGAGGHNSAAGDASAVSGIACDTEAQCGPDFPYCAEGSCVQCITDTNCGWSTCNQVTNTCDGVAPGSSPTVGGPRFPGASGGAGFPLAPGFGPGTADDCPPVDGIGTSPTQQVRASATLCFYGPEDPDVPVATIEQVIESLDEQEYVHLA